MDAVTERQRRFIIRFAYYGILLGIAIFITRYALVGLLPFFIAFAVAMVLKPLVNVLDQKLHLPRLLCAAAVTVLFYGVFALLLSLIGVKLFTTAKDLLTRLPGLYSTRIEPTFLALGEQIRAFVAEADPATAAAWDSLADSMGASLRELLVNISKTAVSYAGNTAVSLPGILVDVLIGIIGTVFFLTDWFFLKSFVLQQVSEKTHTLLHNIKTHLKRTLWNYVRSYGIIMLITFAEISIGLLLIGYGKDSLLIGGLIALFDVLPMVGSGVVLFPWALFALLSGAYRRGIALAVLWATVAVVRNFIEPKVISDRVGLHPIITLLSMFVGTFVFGPIGLLGLPVVLAMCKSLNDAGVVQLYRPYRQVAPPKEPLLQRLLRGAGKKAKKSGEDKQ